MSCLSFNGISGKFPVMLLYGLCFIIQVVILLLQWFSVSNELNKCPADTTTVQRETSNWAGWTNGGSLLLCSIWGILMRNRKKIYSLIIWIFKMLWIGATAVSALLSAVSVGHTLTLETICTDASFDAKTVRNTSVSILVLWILLLGLGHMSAIMRKNNTELSSKSSSKSGKETEIQIHEREPFLRSKREYNNIKF